jgi:NAD(P)-dependent dehydrogenase (short-subunit alcohol dehydrogenase family)
VIDARNDDELQAARAEFVGSGAGEVIAVGGDVTDPAHRKALIEAAERLGGLDLLVNNASTLGATPLPHLVAYDTAELGAVFETNVVAPLALIQDALEGARRPMIVNVTSDASVEHYESWGGYGASKAALDHVSLTLAAEQPGLRIYSVDPGDMRTRMHQDAFPGEDISDRPLPEESAVPGLLALIESDRPSGRYKACDLLTAGAAR